MFNNDDNDFLLTAQEGKLSLKRSAMAGLYILLAIVVIVTGTHAVMLVLSQAPEPTGGESTLLTGALNAIRVSFPITMELAAIVAGLGFIAAKWRKGQKAAAFGIEFFWVIFAAANMITFFRVERGLPLESWQTAWINYGLPLTSLIAGILTYSLTRADPDLKRKDEETAANEKIAMIRFAARRDVEISSQRVAIEKQRAWIDFVKELRSAGYTELQIRYMLQDTPELLIDQDKDGRMDLLEDAPPRQQLPASNAPRQNTASNGVRPMAAETPPMPTETRGNSYHVQFFNSGRAMWEPKVSYPDLDAAKRQADTWARESNYNEHYRVYYQGKEVYHSTEAEQQPPFSNR